MADHTGTNIEAEHGLTVADQEDSSLVPVSEGVNNNLTPTSLETSSFASAHSEFDAIGVAEEMYNASVGGVWGLGTEAQTIFREMEALNKEQLELVREAYNDYYRPQNRDFDSDILGEFSGTEKRSVQALLEGNHARSQAHAIAGLVGGYTSDSDQERIVEILRGASDTQATLAELQILEADNPIEWIRQDLDGKYRERLEALVSGERELERAIALRQAVDEADIERFRNVLSTASESEKVLKLLEKGAVAEGISLEGLIRENFSQLESEESLALIKGDLVRADAALLHRALEDERVATIRGVLQYSSNREKLLAEYETLSEYTEGEHHDFIGDVNSILSINEARRIVALGEHGQLTETERVYFALNVDGADIDAISSVLFKLSSEEIERFKAEYQGEFGHSLEYDVERYADEVGEKKIELILRGPAKDIHEEVARFQEIYELERDGLSLIGRARTAMIDSVTDEGTLLDANFARLNKTLETVSQDGFIDVAEERELRALLKYASGGVDGYSQAVDTVAQAAAITAAAGVTVLTAGAAGAALGTFGVSGLLLSGTSGATGILGGAVGYVGVNGAMRGNNYDWSETEQLRSDASKGALEATLTVSGLRLGRLAGQAATRGSGQIFGAFNKSINTKHSNLIESIANQTADGAWGGGGSEFITALTNGERIEDALKRGVVGSWLGGAGAAAGSLILREQIVTQLRSASRRAIPPETIPVRVGSHSYSDSWRNAIDDISDEALATQKRIAGDREMIGPETWKLLVEDDKFQGWYSRLETPEAESLAARANGPSGLKREDLAESVQLSKSTNALSRGHLLDFVQSGGSVSDIRGIELTLKSGGTYKIQGVVGAGADGLAFIVKRTDLDGEGAELVMKIQRPYEAGGPQEDMFRSELFGLDTYSKSVDSGVPVPRLHGSDTLTHHGKSTGVILMEKIEHSYPLDGYLNAVQRDGSEDKLVELYRKMFEGLEAQVAKGVVHVDLHGGNILVREIPNGNSVTPVFIDWQRMTFDRNAIAGNMHSYEISNKQVVSNTLRMWGEYLDATIHSTRLARANTESNVSSLGKIGDRVENVDYLDVLENFSLKLRAGTIPLSDARGLMSKLEGSIALDGPARESSISQLRISTSPSIFDRGALQFRKFEDVANRIRRNLTEPVLREPLSELAFAPGF